MDARHARYPFLADARRAVEGRGAEETFDPVAVGRPVCHGVDDGDGAPDELPREPAGPQRDDVIIAISLDISGDGSNSPSLVWSEIVKVVFAGELVKCITRSTHRSAGRVAMIRVFAFDRVVSRVELR